MRLHQNQTPNRTNQQVTRRLTNAREQELRTRQSHAVNVVSRLSFLDTIFNIGWLGIPLKFHRAVCSPPTRSCKKGVQPHKASAPICNCTDLDPIDCSLSLSLSVSLSAIVFWLLGKSSRAPSAVPGMRSFLSLGRTSIYSGLVHACGAVVFV